MTLVGAVTNILCKKVTEDQAKQFALENYGILAAYIRSQFVSELAKPKITELNNKRVLGSKSKKLLKKREVKTK